MQFFHFLYLFIVIIYLAIISFIIYIFIYHKPIFNNIFILNISLFYPNNNNHIEQSNTLYYSQLCLLNNIYLIMKNMHLDSLYESHCNTVYQLLIYSIKNYENIKNEQVSLYNTIKKTIATNTNITTNINTNTNDIENNQHLALENLPYLETNLHDAITIHQLIHQYLPQLINKTIDNDNLVGCNTYYLALIVDIQMAMMNLFTNTIKIIS